MPGPDDEESPHSARRASRVTRPPPASLVGAATVALDRHGADAARPQRVAVLAGELERAPLGSRDAFLLSLVDGELSIASLVDASGMDLDEVTAILDRLSGLGFVTFA